MEVQNFKVNDKNIYVVEEHHHVLLPWADYRHKSGKPFISLTLDHHTDVLPANADCSFELTHDNVSKTVSILRHDEHLDWAVKSGIIDRAVIISHENFTVPASEKLQVICDEEWPSPQEILESSSKTVEMASKVLESEFLLKQLSSAIIPDNAVVVLDIDMDYFLTAKALHPNNFEFFLKLVKNSPFITISLERDWVKILRLQNETITSESLLADLLELVRQV